MNYSFIVDDNMAINDDDNNERQHYTLHTSAFQNIFFTVTQEVKNNDKIHDGQIGLK